MTRHNLRLPKHRSVLLLLVWLAMGPQLPAEGEPTTPYPIVDSGVWATNSHPGNISWIDDDHVLFLGSGTVKPITKEEQWALIWDIRTHIVTKYKQHVGRFCFRDGVILYPVVSVEQNSGKRSWTYYRGKLNKEAIDQTPDGKEDRLNCRLISIWPKFSRGKAQMILREEDGYLVRDEEASNVKFENYPIFYFKAGDKEIIPLPFRRFQADLVEYYPFRQAYFLTPSSYFIEETSTHLTSWPPNVPLYVWWLFPDGKVEKVKIPLGKWTKGGLRLYPTSRGVFLVNRHSRSDKDPGDAGAYLVQGIAVEKLISGVLTDISAVSPNGCRVAFSHAPTQEADRSDEKNLRRLKMIDVCVKGVRP